MEMGLLGYQIIPIFLRRTKNIPVKKSKLSEKIIGHGILAIAFCETKLFRNLTANAHTIPNHLIHVFYHSLYPIFPL